MKWPKEQYKIILSGFRQFIDNCGFTIEEIREDYKGTPELNVMYSMWRHVQYDITSDENHPAFSQGVKTRRVQYNPDFILYPKGCNDDHFKTVLKRIKGELGL